MNTVLPDRPLKILLADDDIDDRHFFRKALKNVPIATELETVEDGQFLMDYLMNPLNLLPDVLFLDINMPRKNGLQCIAEIKAQEKLRQVAVVIYSTAVPDDVADIIYNKGAHFYARKSDLHQLEKNISYILTSLVDKEFARPPRNEFILQGTKPKSVGNKKF